MALSLTTAIKNQVAMRVYSGRTYAALGTGYEQDLIDTEGAAALVAGTGAAPDAWAPWFADRIISRIEPNAHPERVESANRTEARSKVDALATYARLSPAYDPASTTEAFVYQMVNVRKFVIAHCARMRPPLFPDPMTIDASWEEVYKNIWNRGNWNMARRTSRPERGRPGPRPSPSDRRRSRPRAAPEPTWSSRPGPMRSCTSTR